MNLVGPQKTRTANPGSAGGKQADKGNTAFGSRRHNLRQAHFFMYLYDRIKAIPIDNPKVLKRQLWIKQHFKPGMEFKTIDGKRHIVEYVAYNGTAIKCKNEMGFITYSQINRAVIKDNGAASTNEKMDRTGA